MKKEKEINSIITAVLYISMFGCIATIFRLMPLIVMDETGIAISTLVLTVALMPILFFIAKIKKWALISFFAVQILSCFLIPVFNMDNYLELCLEFLARGLFTCIILSLLLLLKKNGEMAWKTFFKKDVYVNDEDNKTK